MNVIVRLLKVPIIVLLLLLWCTSLVKSSTECGAMFKGKCSCGMTMYYDRMQYVVNCTNAGFPNTTVLETMPPEVEVVIFTGNYLETLPWNIFGTIKDYPKLRFIDMSNNHIREIRGKTYHRVAQVEYLILNHNNLSISSSEDLLHPRIFSNFINLKSLHLTNAFADFTSSSLSQDLHTIFVNSNLTKLTKLHLEQNEITRFKDRNVFCDLPQLSELYMGENSLSEINFNLRCLHHLRFLDLERNRFEMVKQRDLDELNFLENGAKRTQNLIVDFADNPFSCDCSVFNFVKWLRETRIEVRNKEHLKCYRNEDSTEPIMTLPFHSCVVRTQHHNTDTGHTVTLVFLLVVLIFIMLGLIGALLYVNKDRIKYFVSPVVSRKVHYTTIKDDEIPQIAHV